MERNSVGWFEIYVQDVKAARKFYEAVFQVNLERLDNPDIELWSFPGSTDKLGANGALVKMEGVSSGGNSTLVYFSCLDCAVESKRVEENGGAINKPKRSIGEYGYIALVTDTEGNMFGLHSMK